MEWSLLCRIIPHTSNLIILHMRNFFLVVVVIAAVNGSFMGNESLRPSSSSESVPNRSSSLSSQVSAGMATVVSTIHETAKAVKQGFQYVSTPVRYDLRKLGKNNPE